MARTADTDYYTQWTSLRDEELTVKNVNDILSEIPDDLWVAAACIDRVVDNNDVQRTLLVLGIKRTDSAIGRLEKFLRTQGGTSTGSSSRQRAISTYFSSNTTDALLCRIRALLLERMDRFRTYEETQEALGSEGRDYALEAKNADEDDWEDDPWAGNDVEESVKKILTKAPLHPPLTLSTFLLENLALIAMTLASSMQYDALKSLLLRHRREVFPYRLHIISAIPPFADPSAYRELLPGVDMKSGLEKKLPDMPWRSQVDLVEDSGVRQAFSAVQCEIITYEPESDAAREYPSLPGPLTSEGILAWYQNRVEAILSSNGFVDSALSLIQHATARGVIGLDELGEELSLISRLVYDTSCFDPRKPIQSISLSQWRSLEPSEVVQRYLCNSMPDSIVQDIWRLVMPYLYVLESRAERAGKLDLGLSKRMLYDYILHSRLDLIVPIFESSKPTMVASQRLISNDEDLARLALACLYGSDNITDWAGMSRIFECLPVWRFVTDEEEDEADETVATLGSFLAPSSTRQQASPAELFLFFKPLPARSLSRALDILDMHLESGEILARWGVPVPLRWLLQSAHDEAQQRAWAIRMARQTNAPSGDLNSKDIWTSLLDDMLKLAKQDEFDTNSAFDALSTHEIRQIFFRGLLSTGRFAIAKRLVVLRRGEVLLGNDTIERLCLDCSREFYDNASSGNYNVGDMKLAYECLSVALQTSEIQREREFIEATSRISSFNVMSKPGIPITPLEIRLTKDKLSLVSRILSSYESAYKHSEELLELVRKLGFRDDALAEVKTLAMIADAALQAEDFPRAFGASERMVNIVMPLREHYASIGSDGDARVLEATDVCWVACFQLGRQAEIFDVEYIDRKIALIGRALELCPPDKLVDILALWRKLERQQIERRRERVIEKQKQRQWNEKGGRVMGWPRAGLVRGGISTLSSKLQGLHMASPVLPSASALASHTFNRVAASFPFSMHGHSPNDRAHSRESSPNVQAGHVLQRGIGWLIGTDEDEV